MKKILVAMSGGVDSSVTAYILKSRGYECAGCTMKLFDSSASWAQTMDSPNKTCCSTDDVLDAKSVASRLDMDHYVLNYTEDFTRCVIEPFVCSYINGETPNPCIECNKHLKFSKMLNQAKALGYDMIATGHYAKVEKSPEGHYLLKKAVNPEKDQSYVLYNVTQEELACISLPLGELSKEQVRAIADEQGFVNAHKPDSQDICFVPDGDYASMISRYTNKSFQEGDFVDTKGNVLGRHKGLIHYTIGQRRGLGIAASDRLYVLRLDIPNNRVILGSNEELFNTIVSVKSFNWIAGTDIPNEFRCSAKIRYKHKEQPCTVKHLGEGRINIVFDEPQRAATPGQSAVLYDGDIVLGGGIIC